MNKLTITAILLSISFVSASAYAGMGSGQKCNKHKGHKQFSLIDTNNDGSLSKEEVLNFHEQHFILMDADADGLVTKEEMKTYRKKQHFMRMDSNKDGVISEDEMMQSSKSHKKRSQESKSNDTE
jgi:Ca2+-binding EF-hand superfamily protein